MGLSICRKVLVCKTPNSLLFSLKFKSLGINGFLGFSFGLGIFFGLIMFNCAGLLTDAGFVMMSAGSCFSWLTNSSVVMASVGSCFEVLDGFGTGFDTGFGTGFDTGFGDGVGDSFGDGFGAGFNGEAELFGVEDFVVGFRCLECGILASLTGISVTVGVFTGMSGALLMGGVLPSLNFTGDFVGDFTGDFIGDFTTGLSGAALTGGIIGVLTGFLTGDNIASFASKDFVAIFDVGTGVFLCCCSLAVLVAD